MASKSKTIRDYFTAISTGEIKGFIDTAGDFVFTTISYRKGIKLMHWYVTVSLYYENEHCDITEELIKASELGGQYRSTHRTVSWQDGGKQRMSSVTDIIVPKGRGIAKTTVLTQAIRDALSKYNKMLKSVQDDTKPACMLLKASGDTKKSIFTDVDYKHGILLQKKLNGINCITYMSDSGEGLTGPELVAYSRDKCIITLNDSIKQELLNLLTKAVSLYPKLKVYFCGEIYKHGLSLQEISGAARRSKGDTRPDLEYHIYDMFDLNRLSKPPKEQLKTIDRQRIIDEIFGGFKLDYVIRLENYGVDNREEIDLYTKQFIEEGYEGSIGRRVTSLYEPGLRSSDVVKFKPTYDAEYEVVGFTHGTKGDNAGTIIWQCVTEDGETFNVVPKDISKETMKKWFTLLSASYIYIKNPALLKHDETKHITAASEASESTTPFDEREIDENFVLADNPLVGDSTCIKVKNILFDDYVRGHLLKVEYRDVSESGIPQQCKGVIFRELEDGSATKVMSQIFQ